MSLNVFSREASELWLQVLDLLRIEVSTDGPLNIG